MPRAEMMVYAPSGKCSRVTMPAPEMGVVALGAGQEPSNMMLMYVTPG